MKRIDKIGYKQLIQEYQDRINENPGNYRLWLYKGEIEMIYDEFADSLTSFRKVESINKNYLI